MTLGQRRLSQKTCYIQIHDILTWFAKPEVVSAINCARRGWINVDMDIIACESCGARLFFSTPSSSAQQQVENAASVFSLKLNSGHKLLFPWVDNACDERLAKFPPSTFVGLVDDYKKRCASLLQLLKLPVISSAAISYMWGPLLEHFLKNPPNVENVYGSDDSSATGEEVLPVLYYQGLVAYVDRSLGRRPIAHRLSFVEMAVPYGCPNDPHYRKNAFDVGEDSLGKNAHSLKKSRMF